RAILKKAAACAAKEGITFSFGSETEFYLFRKDEQGRPTKEPFDEAGYMDVAPLDRCENVRREISLTMEKMGLIPIRSHHERGPGQNEINFHYGKPLKAADQMITFKMIVSTVADRYGLYADFSPMPLSGNPGNGYHINIYASDRDGHDVARYAAAGIVEKIRDMTLFLNPADASYVRFGSGTAPDRVDWSSAGDSELMYLETWQGKTRAELRSPDASGNPYLIYSLLIYAGLEGIRNRMELPDISGEDGILLPGSRKEAAKLAASSSFIKNVLPQDILMVYSGK
ncbi:MAG: glutamine synthetase family protein, partial [Lachnospiraceae bacterium]|nr:glutamine synthetase family protein [Lachnospiraceae bacterium]